ncbi:MAG: AraC family transcriptional regulator [Clostridia bacterium]|nr:AraC family transcriptional regulator [Clostridia bacterium]
MISHSGYLVPDNEAPPYEAPLLVMSAGHYRFVQMTRFHTHRPQGRPDYQLLYVAGGTAKFRIGDEWQRVDEGGAVLYCPDEPQEYLYHLEDNPDIYWVHFTGTAAAETVTRCGLHGGAVVSAGVESRYRELFEAIIRELQLKRPLGDELTAVLVQELMVRMARRDRESHTDRPRSAMIENAVREMERRFAEPLTVAALAEQFHVEVCWFSRLFRRQMGASPQQYLMNIRMMKARELLSTTDCPIGEAARLSGYDNPLYFSRLFSRLYGCLPREYRRRQQEGAMR